MMPCVSVGIPTYNRLDSLRKAVASILGQVGNLDLELIISDNASTDGTQEWCEDLASRESRLRYIRHAINRGALANFASVYGSLRGAFWLILGDDDWIDSNYIQACRTALEADISVAIACGRLKLVRTGEVISEVGQSDYVHPDPACRVSQYLSEVNYNAPFHGLMRSSAVARALPLPTGMAGDWRFVARVIAQGGLRCVSTTAIYKSVEGTSHDWRRVARASKAPDWHGLLPYMVVPLGVARDVAVSPVYGSDGAIGRARLMVAATAAAGRRCAEWAVGDAGKRARMLMGRAAKY